MLVKLSKKQQHLNFLQKERWELPHDILHSVLCHSHVSQACTAASLNCSAARDSVQRSWRIPTLTSHAGSASPRSPSASAETLSGELLLLVHCRRRRLRSRRSLRRSALLICRRSCRPTGPSPWGTPTLPLRAEAPGKSLSALPLPAPPSPLSEASAAAGASAGGFRRRCGSPLAVKRLPRSAEQADTWSASASRSAQNSTRSPRT